MSAIVGTIVAEVPLVSGGTRTITVEDSGRAYVTTTSPLLDEGASASPLSFNGEELFDLAQGVLKGRNGEASDEAVKLAAGVLVLISTHQARDAGQ